MNSAFANKSSGFSVYEVTDKHSIKLIKRNCFCLVFLRKRFRKKATEMQIVLPKKMING